MPDIKIAVKRIEMPDVLSATVDCTETDFGTVKAILVFMSYAAEGEQSSAQAASLGAWDGTNVGCAYSTSRSRLTTTDTNRGYSETYVAAIMSYTAVHSKSNCLGWTVAFQTEDSPRLIGTVGNKFLGLELL